MENKINIAILLKNCPTGMELDSPMYDNLYFDKVEEDYRLPISCYTMYHGSKTSVFFTEFGSYNEHKTSKCVIFPKGKTTWEGFHRPFKDGDILFYKHKSNNVKYAFIYKRRIDMHYLLQYCGWFSEKPYLSEQFNTKERIPLYENDDIRFATKEEKENLFKVIKDNGYKWNLETKVLEKISQPKFKDGDIIADEHGNIAIYKGTMWYNKKLAGYYCGYRKSDERFLPEPKRDGHFGVIEELHHATEEEKEKLFQVIIDNGYRWNTETKTLEKLFPYNIGTKVWVKSDKEHKYIHTIVGISYNCFGNLEYEVKEEKTGIVVHYPKELLIPITKEPKFKVGDTIQSKENVEKRTIQLCEKDGYWTTINSWISIDDQDKWELVPNKFDINTLKPFDEVLVRNTNNGRWRGQFYMSYDKNEEYPFECVYNCWKQCIPYEGNEHLHDKTDDCDNYYRNWE